jgi:N-acetylglucosamine-6-phosphate deacetylase
VTTPTTRAFVLKAARVATPQEILTDGFVVVEGGTVSQVGHGEPPVGPLPVIDVGDNMVAAGFVDIHVHGGGGAEVNCRTSGEVEAAVRQMAQFHSTHGTTALVATTVSDSSDALIAAVEGVRAVVQDQSPAIAPQGACILGSNLEGPWISPRRAGAQFPGAIRPPSISELEDLIIRSRGTLRLVTIAPELPGAIDMVRAANQDGLLVAIGHTDADYETAAAAFDAGARHATHLFNAMAPIHHRHPGPVAAALEDDRVTLEIIADGVHIHPALISLVAGLAPGRIVLITDAIGATGTEPGLHRLGPLEVMVRDGKAVLANHEETVAGSVLTMDRAVALAVQVAGVPLLRALQAASMHPCDSLGEKQKGRLSPGADADLVVLTPDLSVAATVVGGHVVHDPGRILVDLTSNAWTGAAPAS